jgi:WW domain-binding protein 4
MYTQNHKGPSASSSKPAKSGDKFANYSTASQLGLVEEDETVPTTFEIEQMVRNQDTRIGQWEQVVNEPTGLYSGNGVKTEHGADEEEETEGWKFQHKGKRPVRDPYYDDDFDPSAILKMRKKVKQDGEPPAAVVMPTPEELAAQEGALDREKWSGRIELNPATSPTKRDGLVYQKGGGWVELEHGGEGEGSGPQDEDTKPNAQELDDRIATDDTKPDATVRDDEDTKAVLPNLTSGHDEAGGDKGADSLKADAPAGESGGGLFKKRRPPPSSRKK